MIRSRGNGALRPVDIFLRGRPGGRVGLGQSLSPAPNGLAPQVDVKLNIGLSERVNDPVGKQVPPSECRRLMVAIHLAVVGLENLGIVVIVSSVM